jgi:hypothetical protein
MNKRTCALAALLVLAACDDAGGPTALTFAVEGDEADEAPAVVIRNKLGEERSVALGDLASFRDEAVRAAEIVRSRENVEGIYRQLHRTVQGSRFERELALIDPRELAAVDDATLMEMVRRVVARNDEIRLELFPETVISGPAAPEVSFDPGLLMPCIGGWPADEGEGQGSDMETVGVGGGACSLSPKGIVANDPRPYREHLGCVRDQGPKRGTCVAFALASAFEMGHSVETGTRINLSEQRLYFEAKKYSKYLSDGLKTFDTLQEIAAKQWTIPFEAAWNYNPSPHREWVIVDQKKIWADSCLGYAETCSDTAHQGTKVCHETRGGTVCEGVGPPLGQGGVQIGFGGLQLWDPQDPELSIDLIKAALFSGTQVVVSLMVNNAFKAAVNGDGFIAYAGEPQSSYGAHAMHIVSYIDNDDLAKIAPDAPPGEHGGYFIARNSWGPCVGDGGHIYIPYRWMKPAWFVNVAAQILPANVIPQ